VALDGQGEMAANGKLNIGFMIVGIVGPLLILGYILRSSPVDAWTILGLAIFFPSLALWTAAHARLGKSFAVRAKAGKLVTGGIYSKIRHPIYVFGFLLILSLIICAKQPAWLAPLALLAVMQIRRARKEEHVLEAKFGDSYREYKKKTWF
jgi:protein-S-isoprenylcysteine O-methyltransferase Ste14